MNCNIQERKKVLFCSEIFESIQGETSLAGLMTTFLRLSGCPLRCRWCDSSYSFANGIPYTFADLFTQIDNFGWNYVCITGGEPLMQQATIPFMKALLQKGYKISLETSGALSTEFVPEDVLVILDVKCPGSLMESQNRIENFSHLKLHDQVKFVLSDRTDYEWAKAFLQKHTLFEKVSEVLFSPVWGELAPEDLIFWLQQDKIPVRLNLQLHKYVFGPTTRGV